MTSLHGKKRLATANFLSLLF